MQMLATPNSVTAGKPHFYTSCYKTAIYKILSPFLGATLAVLALLASGSRTVAEIKDRARFGPILEKTYADAKALAAASPAKTNDLEAQWKFARACFDLADFVDTNTRREQISKEGIAASKKVIETSAGMVEGHYYLAMNLGELAETKSLGALRIVPQMETEFKTALALNADFDHAGPDRNLGMLYLQAPGWPTSVGSNSKSKQHLQAALKKSPDYPENLLNIIEAEIGWGEKTAALKHLEELDTLWPKATLALNAPEWQIDWADWENRRTTLRGKLAKTAKAAEAHKNVGEK
jgi:hypothetical protein